MDWKTFFKDKKITVMGLGLLGRGIGDVAFLAKCGAELIVTDLKTKEQLADSLNKLKKYKNIKFTLGGHDFADFRDRDFILKAAGVPLDSPYIAEAEKNKIPIKMSTALFVKFAKEIGAKIVGITGTRGKTTTTYLIYEILKKAKNRVHLGGNIKGVSTLAMLPKIKKGDIVVLELDSWQLQGFGVEKMSPDVSVFTNILPDHLNYYKGDKKLYFEDKANIYKFQTDRDIFVAGEQMRSFVENGYEMKNKKITVGVKDFPNNWKMKILGEHNKYNASLSIAVARVLLVPEDVIKKTVENFKGVEGRMELVKIFKGVKIYNDTTATTPDATVAALKALSTRHETRGRGHETRNTRHEARDNKSGLEKNIILIMGGADKNLDMSGLLEEIPKYCKKVVMLEGSGTERISNFQFLISNQFPISKFSNLGDALKEAIEYADKGDIILFSPAFTSFGMFKNEYDRGEQFNAIVNSL